MNFEHRIKDMRLYTQSTKAERFTDLIQSQQNTPESTWYQIIDSRVPSEWATDSHLAKEMISIRTRKDKRQPYLTRGAARHSRRLPGHASGVPLSHRKINSGALGCVLRPDSDVEPESAHRGIGIGTEDVE